MDSGDQLVCEQLLRDLPRWCQSQNVVGHLRALLRLRLSALVGGVATDLPLPHPLTLLVSDLLASMRLYLSRSMLSAECGQFVTAASSDCRLGREEVREVLAWCCPDLPVDDVWDKYCHSDQSLCLLVMNELSARCPKPAGGEGSSVVYDKSCQVDELYTRPEQLEAGSQTVNSSTERETQTVFVLPSQESSSVRRDRHSSASQRVTSWLPTTWNLTPVSNRLSDQLPGYSESTQPLSHVAKSAYPPGECVVNRPNSFALTQLSHTEAATVMTAAMYRPSVTGHNQHSSAGSNDRLPETKAVMSSMVQTSLHQPLFPSVTGESRTRPGVMETDAEKAVGFDSSSTVSLLSLKDQATQTVDSAHLGEILRWARVGSNIPAISQKNEGRPTGVAGANTNFTQCLSSSDRQASASSRTASTQTAHLLSNGKQNDSEILNQGQQPIVPPVCGAVSLVIRNEGLPHTADSGQRSFRNTLLASSVSVDRSEHIAVATSSATSIPRLVSSEVAVGFQKSSTVLHDKDRLIQCLEKRLTELEKALLAKSSADNVGRKLEVKNPLTDVTDSSQSVHNIAPGDKTEYRALFEKQNLLLGKLTQRTVELQEQLTALKPLVTHKEEGQNAGLLNDRTRQSEDPAGGGLEGVPVADQAATARDCRDLGQAAGDSLQSSTAVTARGDSTLEARARLRQFSSAAQEVEEKLLRHQRHAKSLTHAVELAKRRLFPASAVRTHDQLAQGDFVSSAAVAAYRGQSAPASMWLRDHRLESCTTRTRPKTASRVPSSAHGASSLRNVPVVSRGQSMSTGFPAHPVRDKPVAFESKTSRGNLAKTVPVSPALMLLRKCVGNVPGRPLYCPQLTFQSPLCSTDSSESDGVIPSGNGSNSAHASYIFPAPVDAVSSRSPSDVTLAASAGRMSQHCPASDYYRSFEMLNGASSTRNLYSIAPSCLPDGSGYRLADSARPVTDNRDDLVAMGSSSASNRVSQSQVPVTVTRPSRLSATNPEPAVTEALNLDAQWKNSRQLAVSATEDVLRARHVFTSPGKEKWHSANAETASKLVSSAPHNTIAASCNKDTGDQPDIDPAWRLLAGVEAAGFSLPLANSISDGYKPPSSDPEVRFGLKQLTPVSSTDFDARVVGEKVLIFSSESEVALPLFGEGATAQVVSDTPARGLCSHPLPSQSPLYSQPPRSQSPLYSQPPRSQSHIYSQQPPRSQSPLYSGSSLHHSNSSHTKGSDMSTGVVENVEDDDNFF